MCPCTFLHMMITCMACKDNTHSGDKCIIVANNKVIYSV